jgi:hypothetical protein
VIAAVIFARLIRRNSNFGPVSPPVGSPDLILAALRCFRTRLSLPNQRGVGSSGGTFSLVPRVVADSREL